MKKFWKYVLIIYIACLPIFGLYMWGDTNWIIPDFIGIPVIFYVIFLTGGVFYFGNQYRKCSANCRNANPNSNCNCWCEGEYHGINHR